MLSRQEQLAERTARQARSDEVCVEPVWMQNVDRVLLDLGFDGFSVSSSVILLPELRFKTLLKGVLDRISSGKVMIVDALNTRFEQLKSSVSNEKASLYFSAQEVSSLNYASDVFHLALTEIGLSTLLRLEQVLPSYRRVLKSDGRLILATPVEGSFEAFFDIFGESLYCLYPDFHEVVMEEIDESMRTKNFEEVVIDSGFDVLEARDMAFKLEFPNAEQMLFSTLVESHYLGVCMGLRRPEIDSRALLTHVVRSFHHYFQGESITVDMHYRCMSCGKSPSFSSGF